MAHLVQLNDHLFHEAISSRLLTLILSFSNARFVMCMRGFKVWSEQYVWTSIYWSDHGIFIYFGATRQYRSINCLEYHCTALTVWILFQFFACIMSQSVTCMIRFIFEVEVSHKNQDHLCNFSFTFVFVALICPICLIFSAHFRFWRLSSLEFYILFAFLAIQLIMKLFFFDPSTFLLKLSVIGL